MEFVFKDYIFGIFVIFIIFEKERKVIVRKIVCIFFLFRMYNMIFVSLDFVLDLNYYFLFLILK